MNINKTEIKRKWVENLRSGKYNQAIEALYTPGDESAGSPSGYCCLGVLLDTLDAELLNPLGLKWEENKLYVRRRYNETSDEIEYYDPDQSYLDISKYDDWSLWDSEELPDQLLRCLNIPQSQHAELISMNDVHSFEFDQIADYIEEQSDIIAD